MSVRFVIDPLDFVRKAGEHHGKIRLADLERLQDFLYENKGEVRYRINGALDLNNKPRLQIEVTGKMCLSCQRCLGRLAHMLDIKTSLLLVETETELIQTDMDGTVDAVLATIDMDVTDLIEDEIILSLSISSRHNEGECEMHDPERRKVCKETNPENPFAALKALKK